MADDARTVLVLGDTTEARELARLLEAEPGLRVVPAPAGDPDGLAAWLQEHEVRAVVDAADPFAAYIAQNTIAACERTATPLLRLELEGWRPRAGDRWRWVADIDEASRTFEHNTRVLLTTGPRALHAFAHRDDAWFLLRCVEQPEAPLPPNHQVLLDRGPYSVESELALIDEHGIQIVVTQDTGGAHEQAKLDAARERGLPVVIVRRPSRPQVTTLTSVDGALRWARHHA